ncbi:SDR family NAD(P)-dependent oxidoreductase [Cellulomonas fimi]|uniref:SDR family NAD(P)-dependent oxidoreductase n=1 Tax=Cellulomonas fimi TaxID=1708 RepID=UPI001B865E9E|nr:SDR family oxidoreductase [Cellulomonas fimi]
MTIVTGAAGGIGEGVAQALLDDGARVALWDLSKERTEQVARRLDPSGERVLALEADVTDQDAVDAAVAATTAHFGRLDGLVNNAGVIAMAPSWEEDAAHWRRHLEVNVTGTFVCSKAVGDVFRSSGGGAIVNVASNCGKAGYRNMAAYNASKSAVIGLTRSLAMEWADVGINVNAVCPGGVDTPMLSQVADWLSPRIDVPAEELLAGMGAEQLGGRRIMPIEIGRVIAFLLSNAAVIIRGQSISVDAGATPY